MKKRFYGSIALFLFVAALTFTVVVSSSPAGACCVPCNCSCNGVANTGRLNAQGVCERTVCHKGDCVCALWCYIDP